MFTKGESRYLSCVSFEFVHQLHCGRTPNVDLIPVTSTSQEFSVRSDGQSIDSRTMHFDIFFASFHSSSALNRFDSTTCFQVPFDYASTFAGWIDKFIVTRHDHTRDGQTVGIFQSLNAFFVHAEVGVGNFGVQSSQFFKHILLQSGIDRLIVQLLIFILLLVNVSNFVQILFSHSNLLLLFRFFKLFLFQLTKLSFVCPQRFQSIFFTALLFSVDELVVRFDFFVFNLALFGCFAFDRMFLRFNSREKTVNRSNILFAGWLITFTAYRSFALFGQIFVKFSNEEGHFLFARLRTLGFWRAFELVLETNESQFWLAQEKLEQRKWNAD